MPLAGNVVSLNSTNPSRATSRLLRAAVALTLSFAAASVHAVGITSERLLASIIQETPQSTLVARGQEMARAEAAAAAIRGAEALWGVGASMEPLYISRTAIVVAPVKFKDLKKGMTVVYLNGRGRRVAHVLTGDLPQGWIAQGLSNDEEDDDLVTPENLVGVIVQAYSEMHSEFRVGLTQRLVAKGRLTVNQG
jgi:hypothetical protein